MKIDVILKENVENLGSIGDIVKVSAGYARNFLLPRQLVSVAHLSQKNQLEHLKKILERKKEEKQQQTSALADKMKNYELFISRKVVEKEKIFGSVTALDIFSGLMEAGFLIKKKSVLLENPIRLLGTFPVEIALDHDLKIEIKVIVQPLSE